MRKKNLNSRKVICTLLALVIAATLLSNCRQRQSDLFIIALADKIQTLDTLTAQAVDAGSERLRQLLFNSLIRKNEKANSVPKSAKEPAKAGISEPVQQKSAAKGAKTYGASDRQALDRLVQTGGER